MKDGFRFKAEIQHTTTRETWKARKEERKEGRKRGKEGRRERKKEGG